MKINRKGFTLIELLIVIAIIAVLATVVILSLNPAELLRQSRDSNRVSDMATLKSAIALYLADYSTPSMGTAGTCYVSVATTTGAYTLASSTGSQSQTSTCVYWMATAPSTVSASSSRGIGSGTSTVTGWLPIAFSAISSGAPIGNEPIDPVNSIGSSGCATTALSSCALYYSYVASSTNYKVAAKMESTKYAKGGGGDVESNTADGGIDNYMYEQGTSLSL